MGNANAHSKSVDSLGSEGKKSTPSRLEQFRSTLRNSKNKKSSKEDEKLHKHSEDKANNNNNGVSIIC